MASPGDFWTYGTFIFHKAALKKSRTVSNEFKVYRHTNNCCTWIKLRTTSLSLNEQEHERDRFSDHNRSLYFSQPECYILTSSKDFCH